ncbi:MAG: hypothetical protein ACOC5I_00055 [Gemmatimonadota bacterium]
MAVAVLALLGATGWGAREASAQTAAQATARITIAPVMRMAIEAGGGTPVAMGEHLELERAVRVRVSSNAPWRLLARVRGPEPKTASVGAGTGPVVTPVWIRARHASRSAVVPLDYVPITAGAVVVAEGGAGWNQEIELDCRWLEAPGAGSVPDLEFELVAVDGP